MDSFKGDSPQEPGPTEISEEEMQTFVLKSVFMTPTRAVRRDMDEKNFIVQFVVKLTNTITTKTKLVIKPVDMSGLIKTVTEKTAGKLPAELPKSEDRIVMSVFKGLKKVYKSNNLLHFDITFCQQIFEANVARILMSELNNITEKKIKGSVLRENPSHQFSSKMVSSLRSFGQTSQMALHEPSPAEMSEEQMETFHSNAVFMSGTGGKTGETEERNFIIQFLMKLINMIASKTHTETKWVNIFRILESVIEMTVGKLPAKLPRCLDKLVTAVYKSLKKTYKSKIMLQTAMEFRQLNFEDNVAKTLISETKKMKEKRIKVYTVVTENGNNSSDQSSSKIFGNLCSFGQCLKKMFSFKVIVEIRR